MNKSTYIKNLQTYLSGLTKDEQNDVIDFYSEYIGCKPIPETTFKRAYNE